MILVDTYIWIDHFRVANRYLVELLNQELVCIHPWVVGELACGNLADRKNTLYLLRSLPQDMVATDREVLLFIENHGIADKGIGYLDMHLLAATALNSQKIWTRDRRLNEVASLLGLNASVTS